MAHEEDGFLQRWSRRKQEAARPPAPPAPAADPHAAPRAEAAERARQEVEAREREAVLARLPKLEDLTAQSDFRLFMHPLVPAALRGAALARMWTLDPAIRDFVGPARDYAWDWNVPGGVPGGGPAPSLADVEATLRRLTARLDAEAAREAEAMGDTAGTARALPSPAAEAPAVPLAAEGRAALESPRLPEPISAPDAPQAAPEGGSVPSRRRHGGATPT